MGAGRLFAAGQSARTQKCFSGREGGEEALFPPVQCGYGHEKGGILPQRFHKFPLPRFCVSELGRLLTVG